MICTEMGEIIDALFNLMSWRVLILVIVVIGILFFGLIVAIIFERRLIKELTKKRLSEKTTFEREIANLKKSRAPPEEIFSSIDKSARDFLSKKYNINKNVDYSEIMKIFAEKKNKAVEGFSKNMLESIYSGKKVDEKTVRILLKELHEMVGRSGKRLVVGRDRTKSLLRYNKPKKSTLIGTVKLNDDSKYDNNREGEKDKKELMNSNAMVMMNKLQLQRNVLERAHSEGYVSKKSYEISLHNIDILSKRLKEKYL